MYLNKIRFIFFSDQNNEELVRSLIYSFESIGLDKKCKFTYFSLNYESNITHQNTDVIKMETPIIFGDVRDFQLMKPKILLESLKRYPNEEYFIYLDTDIILSHRFDPVKFIDEDLINFSPIPLCPWHPVNQDNNSIFMLDNHYRVFGSDYKLSYIIQDCFILFSKKQKWFIEEWDALCQSKWYLDKLGIPTHSDYFFASDESVFWGLMIKNKCEFSLRHIHVNHSVDLWIEFSENNEGAWYSTEDPQNGHKNTSNILFYHMMKDPVENFRIIDNFIKKRWIEING